MAKQKTKGNYTSYLDFAGILAEMLPEQIDKLKVVSNERDFHATELEIIHAVTHMESLIDWAKLDFSGKEMPKDEAFEVGNQKRELPRCGY